MFTGLDAGTFWKGLGVVVAAFLLILFIKWVTGDTSEWGPLTYGLAVMAGMLYYLVVSVEGKKKKTPPNT